MLCSHMKLFSVLSGLFCLVLLCGTGFADNRNDASEYTIAIHEKMNDTPAWDNNEEDFDFATRGFIATDDASVVERSGYDITIVDGDYGNIKITSFSFRPL